MRKTRTLYVVLALLLIAAAVLTACGKKSTSTPAPAATQPPAQQAPTQAPTKAPTKAPTQAPTQPPALGTEANPIIWVLTPSQDTQKVLAGAEPIAQYIEEKTGLVIVPKIPTDYAAQIEAMCSGEAQMAALNTFGYVRAHQKNCADVALASVRYGSTSYAGQIITQANSGITGLKDLVGKTFCRPDPESTSGWVMPKLMMLGAGIDPDKDLARIVDTGGHDATVLAVYNGDCDAGATFQDARVLVAKDYPDVNDKVVVIAQSPPIPNDNISFRPDFPKDLREKIVTALLSLNDSDQGKAMLKGLFSWQGLEKVDDSFYDGFRQALEASGLSIEDLSK